jgi:hypothetical protein
VGVTGIAFQTYLSIQHIQSAAYFAKQTARLERRALRNPLNVALKTQVVANFTATIFSSVAFLEALLNELWADCEQSDGGHMEVIPQEIRCRITEALQYSRNMELVKKFKTLLKAAERPIIPCDRRPLQDISNLIAIRNNMVHYNAAWLDSGSPEMCRAERLEESELGKFIDKYLDTTPNIGWMNAANAGWAVRLVILYAEAAAMNLGITPLHDHVRAELQPFTH